MIPKDSAEGTCAPVGGNRSPGVNGPPFARRHSDEQLGYEYSPAGQTVRMELVPAVCVPRS